MPRCAAIKANGEHCKGVAAHASQWCAAHHPDYQERRRTGASKGGKTKASRITKDLHTLLEDLTQNVIDGMLSTSQGAVANQLIGTRIRLLDYERRLKETEELEERIERLEQVAVQG